MGTVTLALGVALVAALVRRTGWERATIALLAVVVATRGLAVFERGRDVGHFPAQTAYELDLLLAFLAPAASLAVALGLRVAGRGARATAPLAAAGCAIALLALVASRSAITRPDELPPALQSPWLYVHVPAIVAGHGLVLIAAGVALLTRSRAGVDVPLRLGFVALTIGLASGVIWSHEAWGEGLFSLTRANTTLLAWIVVGLAVWSRESAAVGRARPWLLGASAAAVFLTTFGFGFLPDAQRSLHRFEDPSIPPEEGRLHADPSRADPTEPSGPLFR